VLAEAAQVQARATGDVLVALPSSRRACGNARVLTAREVLRHAADHIAEIGEAFLLDLLAADRDDRRWCCAAPDTRTRNGDALQRGRLRLLPWRLRLLVHRRSRFCLGWFYGLTGLPDHDRGVVDETPFQSAAHQQFLQRFTPCLLTADGRC